MESTSILQFSSHSLKSTTMERSRSGQFNGHGNVSCEKQVFALSIHRIHLLSSIVHFTLIAFIARNCTQHSDEQLAIELFEVVTVTRDNDVISM